MVLVKAKENNQSLGSSPAAAAGHQVDNTRGDWIGAAQAAQAARAQLMSGNQPLGSDSDRPGAGQQWQRPGVGH